MGFNRDVIRRRRDQLNEVGVRGRWAGRTPRLGRSVIRELQDAERMTEGNSVLTLQFCVNYGGGGQKADAGGAPPPGGGGGGGGGRAESGQNQRETRGPLSG